jgi:hypothetical protein
VLAGTALLSALPIVGALATDFTVGPVLSATGAVAALIGVLLGDGVPIDDDIRPIHVSRRAIGNQDDGLVLQRTK